jgi:hypothetical protein
VQPVDPLLHDRAQTLIDRTRRWTRRRNRSSVLEPAVTPVAVATSGIDAPRRSPHDHRRSLRGSIVQQRIPTRLLVTSTGLLKTVVPPMFPTTAPLRLVGTASCRFETKDQRPETGVT